MRHDRRWTGVRLLAAVAMCAAVAHPSGARRAPPVTSRASGAATPIWHLAGEGRGRPAVDGGIVYFLSRRHEVLAVDSASGAVQWRRHTAEPGEATMGTSIVATGSVVVAGDYNLVAFARETGAVRWRFVPSDGYGPGIYLGGAAGGVVFAGSPAGRLYAVDGETGAERWSMSVAADARTTVFPPIVDGDRVVAAYTTFSTPNAGGVGAYDRRTGALKWHTPFPPMPESGHDRERAGGAAAAGGPVAADGLILAASAAGVIYAFDRDSGRIRGSFPAVADEGAPGSRPDFRPLTAVGRALVAGSLTGCTISYDVDTREERWRYCDPAGASVAFAIGSDERTVYVPYYEGRLVALDAASGRERWHFGGGPDTGFNWLPAASGDRLYVAGSTAGFFALRRP